MNAFNANHKAALDKLLLRMPGVTTGKAFGYPAYKINGKPFAFVESTGVALKLPEGRIRELVAASGTMRWFEPVKGMIWEEWIAIQRLNSADYWLDLGLFEEAVCFAVSAEPTFHPGGNRRRMGLIFN
jgi:hypothetical protein